MTSTETTSASIPDENQPRTAPAEGAGMESECRFNRPPPGSATLRARIVTIGTALALTVASCGGDGTESSTSGGEDVTAAPPASPPPPDADAGSGPGTQPASSVAPTSTPSATIPDGIYRRVATVAEGEAMGLDPQLVREWAGRDGQSPVAFEITGDSWKHLATNEAGIEEVGDRGTSSYDEEGRWVLTNQFGSFPYLWSVRNGVLTLQPDLGFAEDLGIEVPDDVRFNTEGDFVLDESGPTSPDGEVVLTFAHPLLDLPDQIIAFATEVRDRSGGSITFDVRNDAGAEAEVVADVESGAVDLAWVGSRAFPEFDPLLAPLLVDSYELQSAVYEAGIPDRLGESLADRGLQPIAVLPGPLTKMLGVDRSLVQVEDFAGTRVGTMPSELSRSTISALGAEPIDARPQMPLDGLNGLQTQLGSVYGNGYQQQADSVTANLNLAPRDLVVVMNPERFAELTPEHQEVLLAAGAAAVLPAADASVREDERVGPDLCSSPMQVLEATAEDLRSIEQTLGPVYADIETDVDAAEILAEVRAIKEELEAPPATLTC
jgi:TRAP-type C4-dicarboxylate transport system substrate-binding protein